ncbi:MAG: VTT domain-containing protein, partial [Bauldia litoralis]
MTIQTLLDGLWQMISLFAGTFIQEDAAILAGAYLVVVKKFPAVFAYSALLSGVIAGDLIIYWIGRLARRWDKLRWIAARINASAAHKWLDRRLFLAVAVSRVLPTLTFPTFAACGWLGIPFRRFAAAAIASAVVYVTVTFILLTLYGRSLPTWASTYGWIGLGALLLLAWFVRRAFSRKQQRIVLSREPNIEPRANTMAVRDTGLLSVHTGMPPLDAGKVRVAFSERIPPVIYYIPLLIQWLLLGLRYRSLTVPTAANPRIEAGGLIGESKSECMSMPASAASPWLAPTTSIDARGGADPDHDVRQAQMAMAAAGLDYPVIAKPDIGWRGFGVRRIEDESQLRDYLSGFPEGQRLILQQYVPWHGEAGVFYVRRPGRESGEIFSLTLRYFPFVIGDGET